MKIDPDNHTINFIPSDYNAGRKKPILFLHGFTGSADDWAFLFDKLDDRYAPLAIDLPGHGNSSAPENIEPYLEESIVEQIDKLLHRLKLSSLVLCGYSMGGRAALSFAVKYPEKVEALILESSTAGIIPDDDRRKRIEDDNKLAERILNIGVNRFIEEWYDKPLFRSIRENDELFNKLIAGKKINDAIGLANSLKGFSTGRMSNHWESLMNLAMPLLLVTGENDRKFFEINRRMCELIPGAEHVSIPSAGHIAHLEKDGDFVIFLNSFLSKI